MAVVQTNLVAATKVAAPAAATATTSRKGMAQCSFFHAHCNSNSHPSSNHRLSHCRHSGKKQRDSSLINELCIRQGLDTQILTTRSMPSRAEHLGCQGLAMVFLPSPSSCRLWHLQDHIALFDDVTGLLHGRFSIHFHVCIVAFDEAIFHGHFLRKA